jgi:hypothetical protein
MTVENFTIEHKSAWQKALDPIAAFFDLSNISFSHHRCNVREPGRTRRIYKDMQAKQKAYYDRSKQNGRYEFKVEYRRQWRRNRREQGKMVT